MQSAKRRRQVNILAGRQGYQGAQHVMGHQGPQRHQGPQHEANAAAAGGPDSGTSGWSAAPSLAAPHNQSLGLEHAAPHPSPHEDAAGDAVEEAALRTKNQAAAGRNYRSHLLRRIDPSSEFNLARFARHPASDDDTRLIKEVVADGLLCDPQEMDEIINQNQVNALRTAVVLM